MKSAILLSTILFIGSPVLAQNCVLEVSVWANNLAANSGGEVYEGPNAVTIEAATDNLLNNNNLTEDEVASALVDIKDPSVLLFDVGFEGSFSGPGASSSIVIVDGATCAIKNVYSYFEE